MKTRLLLSLLLALPLAVLAADVTGTWKSGFDSQIGHQNYTFTFKQEGTKLTGKANSEAGDRKREAELREGKVEGDAISFVEMLTIQNNEVRISYAGKVSGNGNEIKFTREVGDFAKAEIVARRDQTSGAATASEAKTIRIKAGKSESVKDAEGNIWLADQGFEGGQTLERPDIQIANTKSPDLYRAERYSMDSFSWPVPNGKYVVKLHFAETFDGITGPGQRVFSFNVQGHEFKDFDVWAKAGGPLRAYVESVEVEVTDGKLKITFAPKVENPQINAIEIVPGTAGQASSGTSTPAATTVAEIAPAATAAATNAQTAAGTSPAPIPVLQIDAGKVTGKVSPTLYGLMTEEINFSYEGGIYGELIRNRTFKSNRAESAVLECGRRRDDRSRHEPAAQLRVEREFEIGREQGLEGCARWDRQWRLLGNSGPSEHDLSRLVLRARRRAFGPLTLSMESTDGKTVFASAAISKISGEWKKYEVTLKTGNVQTSKDNRFVINSEQARHGLVPERFALSADLQQSPERHSPGHHAIARGHAAEVPALPRRQLSRRQ